MKALKLKAPLPTEDDEAQSLWQWAQIKRFNDKRLSEYLIMVPNGAYLGGDIRQRHITMARLKRTGFRAGVADYLLAIPTPRYAGLWIELKRRELGVVSQEQSEFLELMDDIGFAVRICRGWEQAKDSIEKYLDECV